MSDYLNQQEVEELFRLFEDIKLDLSDKSFPTRTNSCLLYTSPSPRDATLSRMPSSA